MYVCLFLSFFSFLLSILYVNVRNALIKNKNNKKKTLRAPKIVNFITERFKLRKRGSQMVNFITREKQILLHFHLYLIMY